MTYRELAKKEHPALIGALYEGGVYGCPSDILNGAKDLCERGHPKGSKDKCSKCWDQEIPDQPSQSAKADEGIHMTIAIENVETYGWEAAIRGMRNPMNSWDKSDSGVSVSGEYVVEPNDLDLMKRLVKAGTDHSKFMRMIGVSLDITAPLYWWKEFDTYKVGTVANSCSTMHKIHSKPIELSDFSVDDDIIGLTDCFTRIVADCEFLRQKYLETNDKRYWRGLIQLLPSSYRQRRTVTLNYAVLANMYHGRKTHKLTEWLDFCEWIRSLPYAELITGEEEE